MLKSIIGFGLKQHLSAIIYNLYTRTDAFFLSALSTPLNMGYYSVAKGFTTNILLSVNPITLVMFPHISSSSAEKSKAYSASLFKIIFVIGTSVSFLFFLFAPMLFRIIFGAAYSNSVKHARILAFSIAFLLIQAPMNLWFTGNLKRPLLSAYVSASALISTSMFGFIGLKYFGDYGMSWAMLMSNILSSCIAFKIGSLNSFDLKMKKALITGITGKGGSVK